MRVYNQWLTPSEADVLFEQLRNRILWQEEWIYMFGKRVKVPRLVAWYGDDGAVYSYSGVEHRPRGWFDELLVIKQRLEDDLKACFNSVLCNLYLDGQQSMGWHSDNEPELGEQPLIASLSLGASRYFDFRRKAGQQKFQRVELNAGDLLVMEGAFQQHWQHRVPRQSRVEQARINLTFRSVNRRI
jgi:alkylated DNA repair dioxygenase AlkB